MCGIIAKPGFICTATLGTCAISDTGYGVFPVTPTCKATLAYPLISYWAHWNILAARAVYREFLIWLQNDTEHCGFISPEFQPNPSHGDPFQTNFPKIFNPDFVTHSVRKALCTALLSYYGIGPSTNSNVLYFP